MHFKALFWLSLPASLYFFCYEQTSDNCTMNFKANWMAQSNRTINTLIAELCLGLAHCQADTGRNNISDTLLSRNGFSGHHCLLLTPALRENTEKIFQWEGTYIFFLSIHIALGRHSQECNLGYSDQPLLVLNATGGWVERPCISLCWSAFFV